MMPARRRGEWSEDDRTFLGQNMVAIGDVRDTLPVHPDAEEHVHAAGQICYPCERLFAQERREKCQR